MYAIRRLPEAIHEANDPRPILCSLAQELLSARDRSAGGGSVGPYGPVWSFWIRIWPRMSVSVSTQILNLALSLFHESVGVPTAYTFRCGAQSCLFTVPEPLQDLRECPRIQLKSAASPPTLARISVFSPPLLEQPSGARLE